MGNFLSDYRKYIVAVVTPLVTLVLVYFSTKLPGVVQCTPTETGQSCLVFGVISQEILLGLITAVLTGEAVRRSATNTIDGEPVVKQSEAENQALSLFSNYKAGFLDSQQGATKSSTRKRE